MKRKLLSRASKAECLITGALNLTKKMKAKNIDPVEKASFQKQAEFMSSEAYRLSRAIHIHGDKMSTRMTGNQAAKE